MSKIVKLLYFLHIKVALLLLYTNLQYSESKANLSFCIKGQHELLAQSQVPSPISRKSQVNCPGGLVFHQPFNLKALSSKNETFCVKHSVCDQEWQCGFQKQSITAQIIKLGKPPANDFWIPFKNDATVSRDIPECKPSKLLLMPQQRLSRSKREITGLVPSVRTSTEQIQKEVDDQTKRMFYYLTGINQEQVNSHLRVVKLFKMSTQLVSMICDPAYINPKFLREIEKGFLYLLKEQGFDKLVDLDLDSYNQLKLFLENCATNVTMVKFFGSSCPTGTSIQEVYTIEGPQQSIKRIIYTPDEKVFKWGEYDIVLDAAWSVMNIVHGGCFEFFSRHVNLHHKFQVALEQLFHAALYLRWEHPTQLADDTFYDSIFLTRVNDTMKSMDACVRYLYLLTPYKVQLNRPIHETFYRRKKRSVSDEDDYIWRIFSSRDNFVKTSSEFSSDGSHNMAGFPVDKMNNSEIATCYQSEHDFIEETNYLREIHRCK